MRVNIAIGEVNGTKEQTFNKTVSNSPIDIDIITTTKPTIKSIVIGMTAVLISSNFDTVEPTAPYINAYIKKPRIKKMSIYINKFTGIPKIDEIISLLLQYSSLMRKKSSADPNIATN